MLVVFVRPDGQQRVGSFWLAWGRTARQTWLLQTSVGMYRVHAITSKTGFGWSRQWKCYLTVRRESDPTKPTYINATGKTRSAAISSSRWKLHLFLIKEGIPIKK